MSMLLCIAAKARGGCLAGQPPPLHAEPVSGLIPFASALPISPNDAITDAKGISAKQVQSDEGRGWRSDARVAMSDHAQRSHRLCDADETGDIGAQDVIAGRAIFVGGRRSEEHTSELQSLMRISYD